MTARLPIWRNGHGCIAICGCVARGVLGRSRRRCIDDVAGDALAAALNIKLIQHRDTREIAGILKL